MIAAVLAGGQGKRLRPLTNHVPKPLIEIAENITILDRLLMQIKAAEIDKVYLLVGYLHEKIQQRYGNFWNGMEIEYLVEKESLGTGGAVRNLIESLEKKEEILLMNGDIVTDISFSEIINFHKNGLTMLAVPLVSPFGILEIEGEKIKKFIEKPKLNHWINGGVYVISPDVFEYFLEVEKGDMEKLVFPKLAENNLIYAYKRENCFWKSIDSLKDLEEVKTTLSKKIKF